MFLSIACVERTTIRTNRRAETARPLHPRETLIATHGGGRGEYRRRRTATTGRAETTQRERSVSRRCRPKTRAARLMQPSRSAPTAGSAAAAAAAAPPSPPSLWKLIALEQKTLRVVYYLRSSYRWRRARPAIRSQHGV